MKTKELTINGRCAIEWARTHADATLRAYADPIDDASDDVTIERAEEINAEDPSLIYCQVAEDRLCPLCLQSRIYAEHDGGEPITWDAGNTEPVVSPLCAGCREEHTKALAESRSEAR